MLTVFLSALAALFLGTFAGRVVGLTDGPELTVPIEVAPKAVNLRFETKRITAHAEIPFQIVDRASLRMSIDDLRLDISATMPDARGELVVKARWHLHDLGDEEIADLRERGSAAVIHDGVTTDGVPLAGTSSIRAIPAGD